MLVWKGPEPDKPKNLLKTCAQQLSDIFFCVIPTFGKHVFVFVPKTTTTKLLNDFRAQTSLVMKSFEKLAKGPNKRICRLAKGKV